MSRASVSNRANMHGNESAPSFDYFAVGKAPEIMAKFRTMRIYPRSHRKRSYKVKRAKPSCLTKLRVFFREYRILRILAVAIFLYLQYSACVDYGESAVRGSRVELGASMQLHPPPDLHAWTPS